MTTLLELSDRHQAELVALENATANSATESLRGRLAEIATATTAAWMAAFGSVRAEVSPAAVRPLSDRVGTKLDGVLMAVSVPAWSRGTRGAVHALATGQRQARAEAALFERAAPVSPLGPLPDDVQSSLGGIESALTEQRDAVRAALRAGSTFSALTDALAQAQGAATRIDMAARWSVVRSAAAGARAYADANDLQLVWAAEPDACPICANAAGIVLGSGVAFPIEDKFGQPHAPDEAEPPAHPRCRCRMVVWRPSWAKARTLPADLRARAGANTGPEPASRRPSFAALTLPPSVAATVDHLLRRRAA